MTSQGESQRVWCTACILAMCLLSAASMAWAANTPSKFKRQHVAAASLLAAGRWEEAAEAYRRLVAEDVDDSLAPNAQLGLARALLAAKKYDEALQAYQALEDLVHGQQQRGTLSGQQPISAWLFTAHRGIGKVYEAQRRFDASADAYQQAAVAIGDKAAMADWRARAYMDAARCLDKAGRSQEAIELARRHLPELDSPEFAGTRALVKAMLASLLIRHGAKDRAEALLAEIKSDPQLDEHQYAAARALVQGKRFGPEARFQMRTRRGPDFLAVESAGRYELRIALQPVGNGLFGPHRYGWIMGWYNLQDDPFKTINLSALGFFPLLKPHHIGYLEKRDGDWKRIEYKRFRELNKTLDVALGMQQGPWQWQHGSVRFEVLEDSSVRVRTRTRHDRWPFETIGYTFYPTGQIYVHATFDSEEEQAGVRIGTISFYTVKNAQVGHCEAVEGDWRMSGEGGNSYRTRFVLAHSNPVPSFQFAMPDDILTCGSADEPTQTYINNEIPLVWRRAPVHFTCDRQADTAEYALLMRVYPRDMDSYTAALPYVGDYQHPARLEVSIGMTVTDDVGDPDTDGYNESEGCYVLKAAGGKLAFMLDARDRPRFEPAFKIKQYTGPCPPTVTLDGQPATFGVDYNAAAAGENALILQLLKTYSGRKLAVAIR